MLAPTAVVIGSVTVGPNTSIWPGAIVRGDYGWIRIGANCSLQDNVVLHSSAENPCVVGNGVTVAHSAIVHACRIGDECLVGAGSIVFDGARIGRHSILGIGAVIPSGKHIPPRSVAVGVPAQVARRTTTADVKAIKESYKAYVEMGRRYVRSGTFPTAPC